MSKAEKQAWKETLQSLKSDVMTIDQMAGIFGVHRNTMAKRLKLMDGVERWSRTLYRIPARELPYRHWAIVRPTSST